MCSRAQANGHRCRPHRRGLFWFRRKRRPSASSGPRPRSARPASASRSRGERHARPARRPGAPSSCSANACRNCTRPSAPGSPTRWRPRRPRPIDSKATFGVFSSARVSRFRFADRLIHCTVVHPGNGHFIRDTAMTTSAHPSASGTRAKGSGEHRSFLEQAGISFAALAAAAYSDLGFAADVESRAGAAIPAIDPSNPFATGAPRRRPPQRPTPNADSRSSLSRQKTSRPSAAC